MLATAINKPGKKVDLDHISAEPPKDLTRDAAELRLAQISTELFRLQDLMWGARLNGVLVVLQGRDAAGKDGTIKNVVGALNPRGVTVTSFGVPTKEEAEHDFLWRIHRHAPRKGEVSIFNRSHYEDVLVTRVDKLVGRDVWKRRYDQINAFESMLAAEGTIVLKYFLHITKEEQEERLLEREKHPETAWKLNPDDWRNHAHWKQYTEAYEDVLQKCAQPAAPWFVVPANAKWFRNLVVAESLLLALQPYEKAWHEKLLAEGKQGKAAVTAYRRKLRSLGFKVSK